MEIKVGKVFYSASLYLDTEIGEKSTIEFDEWHVTKIDKRGIFLKRKDNLTWGKLSSKNGDFGWKTNLSSWVKQYYTKRLSPGRFEEELKIYKFYTTKAAAYRSLMPELKKAKRDVLRLYTQVENKIKTFQKKQNSRKKE